MTRKTNKSKPKKKFSALPEVNFPPNIRIHPPMAPAQSLKPISPVEAKASAIAGMQETLSNIQREKGRIKGVIDKLHHQIDNENRKMDELTTRIQQLQVAHAAAKVELAELAKL